VGGPTLELARLSGGRIIGLDIDRATLNELTRCAADQGLSDCIETVRGSMLDMDFPGGSLDVIWSEGSVHFVGFEKALDSWRRFIRPRGFLVVHEMVWLKPEPPPEIATCWQLAYPGMQTVAEHAATVQNLGYDVIGHFALPKDFWWTEYFSPLEEGIRELQGMGSEDRAAQAFVDREQRTLDIYKRFSSWYGSAFFVMQKL
jgi:SAM-dependent methyltransferase